MIVSKFKIEHAEQQFWPRGIKQDGQCLKGGIYCQVRLPNGALMHLINLHLQATYGFDPATVQRDTICVRQHQFGVLKQWIIDIFGRFSITSRDMFILCGDFNTEAFLMNPETKKWIQSVEFEDETENPEDLERVRQSEHLYSFLLNYMRYNNRTFELDNVYHRHHAEFPVTFGDSKLDENGHKVPVETYLTDECEYLDEMCLDYIFQITPCQPDAADCSRPKRQPEPQQPRIQIIEGSARVEKFEHRIEDTPITHLSDHYGLSIRLRLS